MSVKGSPGSNLTREMGITEAEMESRKAFLEFGEEDVRRLTEANDLANQSSPQMIEAFYRHLMAFPETRAFFADRSVLEHVKKKQTEYFLQLTRGEYGAAYVENRLAVGAAHERIGLPVKAYLGAYRVYFDIISGLLLGEYGGDVTRTLDTLRSLIKVMFLDMGLAIDTYIFRRERTIRMQQEAIREISTPVLPVRPGLLVLPIIGAIDTQRARLLTEGLLQSIRANRAKAVVVDVTGVPVMDSKVAGHLVQAVQAARLLGARAIITGIAPEIAQTLVTIGVDLAGMITLADLQSGLEEAERLLGYRVVKAEPPVAGG
jgi:rsbT co-antagonist protein RsbR